MKVVRILLTVAAVIAALIGGLFLGARGISWFSPTAPVASVTESRSRQIIDSVNREEQVVLLSLGIEGYEIADSHGEVWGVPIPGSGKKVFLPYSFNAKLGIEGKEVEISESGDNHFTVLIPSFKFIGHDDIHFEDMIEAGGVLSGTAEKVNQSKLTNQILSDENQAEYISMHTEVLESQAKSFYENLITSIDSTATVDFVYGTAS